jgi:integrase
MPAIRKRNNRYQVQIRRAGFPDISKSFLQYKDAKEWARLMEVQADRAELEPDRKVLETLTLGDLVKRYRDEITPNKRSSEVETIVLNAFLRHSICKRPLSIVSTVDFAKYRDERLKDITAKSLKRNLSAINNMFQVAKDEWGIPIKENPLDKLKLKTNDNKRERRLQEGEYEKLVKAAQTRKNPLIEKVIIFAIETAMRRGEILNLKWDQVDLQRRSATILESKNGHSRTIPLSTKVLEVLRSLDLDSNYVFPVSRDSLRMAWGRLLQVAEITDLRFHDLRHEAVSRLFEKGLSIPEVSSVSGHRNVAMLSRYSHASFNITQSKMK